MKRFLFALPLAGAMMTASLAYAQTTPPASTTPPAGQAEPAAPAATPTPVPAQDESARGDCAEPAGQSTGSGTTDDVQAALDGEQEAEPNTAADGEETADVADEASAAQSESETQPVAGPDAGTAPGGAGSTGFTGGLGGSNIGTSQSQELESSPQQDHPQVASGLDPISGETAIEGPQAPAEPDEDAAVTPTAPEEDAADC